MNYKLLLLFLSMLACSVARVEAVKAYGGPAFAVGDKAECEQYCMPGFTYDEPSHMCKCPDPPKETEETEETEEIEE